MIETHYVYVIGSDEGPVKVGITKNLTARIKTISTGSPVAVRLIYAHPCRDQEHAKEHERSFHELYEEKRLNGEWFGIDAELAIEALSDGFYLEWLFAEAATARRLGKPFHWDRDAVH